MDNQRDFKSSSGIWRDLKPNVFMILNLYYLGMKQTSVAFTVAMCNLLPAIIFINAWILRLENVNRNVKRSIAKVLETTISVSGAMLMTPYKGLMMIRSSSIATVNQESRTESISKDFVKGSIYSVFSCFSFSSFMILQAITLKEYPLQLSLVGLACLSGAALAIVAASLVEHDTAAWLIGCDSKLIAIVYSVLNIVQMITLYFAL
ncbi:WAT1-related protein At2g39510-like [Typha latifolia]|uniref:WAT1-related protein At2g39510-like n=1 Tax=Typha latifolia TaxID=4733 RepID=UPI003C2F5163